MKKESKFWLKVIVSFVLFVIYAFALKRCEEQSIKSKGYNILEYNSTYYRVYDVATNQLYDYNVRTKEFSPIYDENGSYCYK